MTLEEFLPIYSQLKKDKDCGAYEDLAEGLKVYDKNENGTMMAGELAHVMLSLGLYIQIAYTATSHDLTCTPFMTGHVIP